MAIELYTDEKFDPAVEHTSNQQKCSTIKKFLTGFLTLAVAGFLFTSFLTKEHRFLQQVANDEEICPIYNKRAPNGYYTDNSTVEFIMNDKDFRAGSVEKLSAAVQINTSVYDNAPDVKEDPEYWTAFIKFHEFLEKSFPLVYSTFKVEKVNTYGLIFTWEGSDPSLKPLLLTAHQDVVPVQTETIKDWAYPPFEGHYDGTLLYGRGVADCKNLLVGLMETFELIISEKKLSPKRTVVMAFGADEEISGGRFAAKIGTFLEDRYGPDSFYAIIDEGAGTLEKIDDLYIASPATAEKGYTDILFELTTPGGHSSVPPDHTSIGIMSELITLLEANPFEPVLTSSNPALNYFQCIAKYSESMDSKLKNNILRAGWDKVANSKTVEYFNKNVYTKFLIRTSQAIDIIRGGAKSNALPEHVSVTVNHRVSFESSTQATYERSLGFVRQVAEKYGLGIVIDDGSYLLEPTAKGYFTMRFDSRSEPTQVSPTTSDVWALYSGALRHLYEDIIFKGALAKPVVVAPNVPSGNTDTRHYLKLSEHIYRSIPGWGNISLVSGGVHSVNERIEFDQHLQVIAFYYEYLQLVLDEDIA